LFIRLFRGDYLFFNGNCEEAFKFYQSIFGGEFQMVARYKETPPQENLPLKEADMDKLMHISLPISSDTILMGSDSHPAMPPVTYGQHFALSISTDKKEEATRIFNALAEGGKITIPLADMFWGAYYGMLTDKFDFTWMISFDNKTNTAQA